MDHVSFCALWFSCIVALRSPIGKGLSSWLLLMMFIYCILLLSGVVKLGQVWYLIV